MERPTTEPKDQVTRPSAGVADDDRVCISGCREVWVRLAGRPPIGGLALAWSARFGALGATVTCELDGRVRTEWLPITVLDPRPVNGTIDE